MTKRQLQQFLLRFTAGVAASLLAGLAVMQPIFWIGMAGLALWLLIRTWGLIIKWKAYTYQHTSITARYESFSPHYRPIDLDELTAETVVFGGWALAVLIGISSVLCPPLLKSISILLSAAH